MRRIQLRRTKGWRKPEGAVVVARPSKWGNPYRFAQYPRVVHPLGAEEPVRVSDAARRRFAVVDFRAALLACVEDPWGRSHPLPIRVIAESLPELRGRDLACWCPLDQPCHADVLLELANKQSVAAARAARRSAS